MGDLVHHLVLCAAVPAIQQTCVPLHRDVVVYLTGGHVPGYHMGPAYGGSIGSQDGGMPHGYGVVSHLLLRSTLYYTGNAERHVAQASSSVPDSIGYHRPWDPRLPTSGGYTGSQGRWDT